MKIIIKESQYKKIILESVNKNMSDKLESLKEFFTEISKEIKNQIGLDLTFLSTWGVTISGFAKPVSDFIKGEFTEISNENLILLTVGLILTYFQSNTEKLKIVLDEIKKRNLVFEFDSMLNAAEKLKKTFYSFIESLALPVLKYSNILAYTFVIPLLGDFYNLVSGNFSEIDINEIIRIISGYGIINLSGILIKKLLESIVKRFKS